MTLESKSRASDALLSVPLEETNIDVRLRRKLINAGFKTLGEAFDLSDRELDSKIGPDATDKVLALEEAFKKDPNSFENRALTKRKPYRDTALVRKKPIIASTGQTNRAALTHKPKAHRTSYGVRLPVCNESKWLLNFERRARESIELVADHAEDGFIAEALGTISADIIELRLCTKSVFTMCQKMSHTGSSLTAVKGFASQTPDAFLLYMLDSVQRNFTGSSAWKPAFAELGIRDAQSEQMIPRILYEMIGFRGFRTYATSETSLQYFYTMLLHAGLASSDWESIWQRLVLPLARDMHKGKLPSGSYPTADDLIKLANDRYSGYCLANKSAQNLIKKAPEIVGGLLTSALSVGIALVENSMGNNDQIMLSSNLLPALAMESLRSVLANEGSKSGKRASKIIYFPPAELRLEPADGNAPLILHWDKTRFPKEYIGQAVTYRVNGKKLLDAEVLTGFDCGILEEVSIALTPERAFDVEVELATADGSQLGRLFATQSFRANRPGVYEFLRTSDGTLRQKVRPLRRIRDVICLVAPGFKINAKDGMALLNTDLLPCGYTLQTYNMDVMGCGEVIGPNGEQASAWCESFKVTVDRSQVIGEGNSGSDLYPFFGTEGRDTYNSALPSIEIESLLEDFDHRHLEIECICDGRRVSIKRSTAERPGTNDAKSVLLRLDQSMISAFVGEGHLKVRHTESKRAILSYRFSVVPIKRIALESAHITDRDTITATYALITDRNCEIRHGESVSFIRKSTPRYVEVPLSNEWLSATITPTDEKENPSVEAHFFLAGINVHGPQATRGDRSLTADRYNLVEMADSYGTVTIECKGRRASRGAYLSLGAVPKFYKTLPVASSYRIMPFSPLPHAGNNDGDVATELTLALNYECGLHSEKQQSSCILNLGSILLGYGFGKCRLVYTGISEELRTDRPVGYDLAVKLTKTVGKRDVLLCDHISFPAGETRLPLPRVAIEALAGRRSIVATFAAEDLFGDVDYSTGQRIKVKRK